MIPTSTSTSLTLFTSPLHQSIASQAPTSLCPTPILNPPFPSSFHPPPTLIIQLIPHLIPHRLSTFYTPMTLSLSLTRSHRDHFSLPHSPLPSLYALFLSLPQPSPVKLNLLPHVAQPRRHSCLYTTLPTPTFLQFMLTSMPSRSIPPFCPAISALL